MRPTPQAERVTFIGGTLRSPSAPQFALPAQFAHANENYQTTSNKDRDSNTRLARRPTTAPWRSQPAALNIPPELCRTRGSVPRRLSCGFSRISTSTAPPTGPGARSGRAQRAPDPRFRPRAPAKGRTDLGDGCQTRARPRPRLHSDLPTVEGLFGGCALFGRGHLDEAEALAPTGVAVHHQRDRRDLAVCSEQRFPGRLAGVVAIYRVTAAPAAPVSYTPAVPSR